MIKRTLPPVHPGEILSEDYIKERGLSITELADGLGMTRPNLSKILNEKAGSGPEMDVKPSEELKAICINLQKIMTCGKLKRR